MAHFTDSSGMRISLSNQTLRIGETREFGLWGFKDFGGAPLVISVDTPSGKQCAGYADARPSRMLGDIQFFNLTGLREGAGRIDAITRAFETWDYFQLAVSGEMSLPDRLRDDIDDGRITFQSEGHRRLFVAALNNERFNGKIAEISPELQTLLAELGRRSVKIMRTYTPTDPAHSPHAELHGNRQIVRAVDVMEYAGLRMHWTAPRDQLITNVTTLLRDLPAGVRYNIGFVRPVGGLTGSDVRHDVFFHVPPERAAAAFSPDGSWGWGAMIDPPKTQVRAALAGRTCDYVFPDGADHVHIKAF